MAARPIPSRLFLRCCHNVRAPPGQRPANGKHKASAQIFVPGTRTLSPSAPPRPQSAQPAQPAQADQADQSAQADQLLLSSLTVFQFSHLSRENLWPLQVPSQPWRLDPKIMIMGQKRRHGHR